MTDYDPVTFGDRFRKQLNDKKIDLRKLQRRVYAKTDGAPGTSLANLHSWKMGKGPQPPVEPRFNVVQAISEELGVRPEYLLYGGPATEVEYRLQQAKQPNLYDKLIEAIPALQDHNSAVQGAMVVYVLRYADGATRLGHGLSHDLIVKHAKDIWDWIHTPVENWRLVMNEIGLPLDEAAVSDYVASTLHSLKLLLHAVPAHPAPDSPSREED